MNRAASDIQRVFRGSRVIHHKEMSRIRRGTAHAAVVRKVECPSHHVSGWWLVVQRMRWPKSWERSESAWRRVARKCCPASGVATTATLLPRLTMSNLITSRKGQTNPAVTVTVPRARCFRGKLPNAMQVRAGDKNKTGAALPTLTTHTSTHAHARTHARTHAHKHRSFNVWFLPFPLACGGITWPPDGWIPNPSARCETGGETKAAHSQTAWVHGSRVSPHRRHVQ